MTAGTPYAAVLALVAALTGCGRPGQECVRLALRVDPMTVSVPRGHHGSVEFRAHVTVDGAPQEGVKVVFYLRQADTSGEYMGGDVTDARGVAAFGRGYNPSADRERYPRYVAVRAETRGSIRGDDRRVCSADAEAPFSFRET